LEYSYTRLVVQRIDRPANLAVNLNAPAQAVFLDSRSAGKTAKGGVSASAPVLRTAMGGLVVLTQYAVTPVVHAMERVYTNRAA